MTLEKHLNMSAVYRAGILFFALLFSVSAYANGKLKTNGKDSKEELVAEQFAANQLAGYATFKARCTKCHAMARPIKALQTGITPITQSTFDKKGIKKYVVKMMRKPNSGIAKKDAKQIVAFLQHARKLAQGQ